MAAYLKLVMDLLPSFEKFEFVQTLCLKNIHAYALSKLASNNYFKLLRGVYANHFAKPLIAKGDNVMWIDGTPSWMQPIIAFLKKQIVAASKANAQKLQKRAANFMLKDYILYKIELFVTTHPL